MRPSNKIASNEINQNKTIYTIGHSTRDIKTFLELLMAEGIQTLVDIRKLPGSNKYPHFNQDNLEKTLTSEGITYYHLTALGGRRNKKEPNTTRWRNRSFANYATYMKTEDFKAGIKKLETLALEKRTAIMCAEAVWWRCHRSMIADFLKVSGWQIIHILDEKHQQEHPYTSPAEIIDGKLSYAPGETF